MRDYFRMDARDDTFLREIIPRLRRLFQRASACRTPVFLRPQLWALKPNYGFGLDCCTDFDPIFGPRHLPTVGSSYASLILGHLLRFGMNLGRILGKEQG